MVGAVSFEAVNASPRTRRAPSEVAARAELPEELEAGHVGDAGLGDDPRGARVAERLVGGAIGAACAALGHGGGKVAQGCGRLGQAKAAHAGCRTPRDRPQRRTASFAGSLPARYTSAFCAE